MRKRQPVVFLGHGNPMHALADDAFSRTLGKLGRELGKPKAIVCVSAHWTTPGALRVTHMSRPKTIHDFSGFPEELFAVRYAAPGSPKIAELVRKTLGETGVELDDDDWGLDHGAWSVLRHMYPDVDVPVVQLSVDVAASGDRQLEVGRKLAPLRDEGVLIIGSGNVVHNLAEMDWSKKAAPVDWAVAFDSFVKRKTEDGDAGALSGSPDGMPGGSESIPTPEHWYPYLVAMGAADGDKVRWEYEGIENAAISMRGASFGRN